jgi:hypothetical protein
MVLDASLLRLVVAVLCDVGYGVRMPGFCWVMRCRLRSEGAGPRLAAGARLSLRLSGHPPPVAEPLDAQWRNKCTAASGQARLLEVAGDFARLLLIEATGADCPRSQPQPGTLSDDSCTFRDLSGAVNASTHLCSGKILGSARACKTHALCLPRQSSQRNPSGCLQGWRLWGRRGAGAISGCRPQ